VGADAGGGDSVSRIDEPEVVAREYSSLERFKRRRIDVTGWLRFGEDDEWTVLLRAVAEARPRRVLDAGCGDGEISSLIAAPEVVGVDQSPAAVAAARERGLDARVADVRELPFRDREFDLVVCNHVLYHVLDRDRAIAELARVLRAGGRFVGIYSARDHHAELWEAVGDPWADQPAFDCEGGAAELGHHFAHVERRHAGGASLWETREELQAFLDAYEELVGPLVAPKEPYPFVTTRRKCVLVAEKA
jgi:ubiquinone/menaquinone biosynthesis C-methylase UbiE